MEKEKLEELRNREAEKIAEEIYKDKKEWVLSEFICGKNYVRIHIDRGTFEFNGLICHKLSDKFFDESGFWCEYYNMMYCPDCVLKIYPEKPRLKWWQKILG